MTLVPIHFIGQAVEVEFDQPPLLEKRPTRPDRFTWDGRVYQILDTLGEWVDYSRRGRFARNMQPQHAAVASRRGSWGVGRFTFQVLAVAAGSENQPRIFGLYYDRAPKDADSRKGGWVLMAEYEDKAEG